MKFDAKDKILFIGDSITDVERKRPVGEGLFNPYGGGYVGMVHALLGAAYPDRPLRLVNMGISGNTVLDLRDRWQSDVLDLRPDWLSILVGINDVWRQFDSPLYPERAVDPDTYAATLRELIARSRPGLKGLVLMTPYYIEANRADPLRLRMEQYAEIVRALAAETGAVLVDTQAAFDRALRFQHSANLAWDRIHPNTIGHMILARAFLDAVGFDWTRAD